MRVHWKRYNISKMIQDINEWLKKIRSSPRSLLSDDHWKILNTFQKAKALISKLHWLPWMIRRWSSNGLEMDVPFLKDINLKQPMILDTSLSTFSMLILKIRVPICAKQETLLAKQSLLAWSAWIVSNILLYTLYTCVLVCVCACVCVCVRVSVCMSVFIDYIQHDHHVFVK